VGAPARAVGGNGPDQVVGEDEPGLAAGGDGLAHTVGEEGQDQAEVQLPSAEPLVQPVVAPSMPHPIPFPAFPLNPTNLSHPVPTDGAPEVQIQTPDYYALFRSFSDTELVGVWAVNTDLIVPPPDGRSLHNLLEDLQLGIGSSGALLEWQGKGVGRNTLLAILRFPHYVQAQSFLFRVCQLTQVHPTTNLPSGRIPTGSGIALSPYFVGVANKERLERDRCLEMLSIGATDQLKLQEATLTQLKQHHADHAGEPQAATFISDCMLLIQEMTDSIRTHVLPRKGTPPPPCSGASTRNDSTVLHDRTLRIASLNIRGKALGSLPELVKMIGVVGIDILGLQEVFTSRNLKIPGFSWYGLGGDCGST
jgi:hypothetical protein